MSKPGKVHFEQITLLNDSGVECTFNGRLFSESSYYDEDSMTLTRLRLYISDQNEQVYSIISGSGQEKTRRYYVVAQEGELYRISSGAHTLRLPLDILFASVFGLCGLDPHRAEELKPDFEESLRMIVG
jgi:hypothetical protein